MWYTWLLVLVCCALVRAEGTETPLPVATTAKPPPKTLDRQAAELAWKTWLQSPESGNPNAPPRRITTKSLFITPYVCPKGQRLDRNGCVQVLTVDKGEHERILLEQLNALFTASPGGDAYDYGDDEPLQLSIPIGLDPQAAQLQGQDPQAQAQQLQPNYVKVDKKDENKDASIEAELEILKLQNENNTLPTKSNEEGNTVLLNLNSHLDKPKRDNTAVNSTDDSASIAFDDEGQKEQVYGHVNVDPVLYDIIHNINAEQTETEANIETTTTTLTENRAPETNTEANINPSAANVPNNPKPQSFSGTNPSSVVLKKDGDQTKLSPETDYSDIGEAIKLISRYAEVTTDDNFSKDQKKAAMNEDSVLGTRTRLQHRRNKPKVSIMEALRESEPAGYREKVEQGGPMNAVYFRYPWTGQHAATPPPDYPFRHLQDYWAGRTRFGGVYAHENPRRHHHSYPHARPHPYPFPAAYPAPHGYVRHRSAPRDDRDLYSLLGLRHWFTSEGTSKR